MPSDCHNDLPIDFNVKILGHFRPECSFDIWIQGEFGIAFDDFASRLPPKWFAGLDGVPKPTEGRILRKRMKTLNIEITCDVTFALKR